MHCRNKRRRVVRRPAHFHAGVTTAEERLLYAAIQNSKLDQSRPSDGRLSIPWGPTFYPTVEEFEGNPIHYIQKIKPIAERYGICKIVPPEGWNPAPYFAANLKSSKKFQTKHQMLHRLQEGIAFGDGTEYTAEEYQRVASQRTKEWKATYYPNHDLLSRHSDALEEQRRKQEEEQKIVIDTDQNGANTKSHVLTQNNATELPRFVPENIERDYWHIVETHTKQVAVEYGNDIDTSSFGSGFPLSERGRAVNGSVRPDKVNAPEPQFGTEDYYKETWWNLNNIPWAPDGVLRHVKVPITGINVPWLYFGSLFTTFCWHNEDNYLYSINYHHKGAPKQWYGVPGKKECADGLEKVFKSYLSMKMRDVPDLLHHITTMFSPRLLQNSNVPVYKVLQHEGEFVVTFPRAFHGGFSFGPNIGEAVNFAPQDWISFGSDANEKYRSFARPSVFSHDRLTFTMAHHFKDQTCHDTCKSLIRELERVIGEELELRRRLMSTGVRDLSHLITLPANRLDQLDEKSAMYDDRRLCHACKHVCFFSAVACECSQTKVSCLRHSHYMCRCSPERQYFMVWSTKEEFQSILEKIRKHCESLETRELNKASEGENDRGGEETQAAPGAEQDLAKHKNDEISTDPVLAESFLRKLLPH